MSLCAGVDMEQTVIKGTYAARWTLYMSNCTIFASMSIIVHRPFDDPDHVSDARQTKMDAVTLALRVKTVALMTERANSKRHVQRATDDVDIPDILLYR
jgi:hypothetical protein